MDVFRITSIVLHDDDFFLHDIHSSFFKSGLFTYPQTVAFACFIKYV